MHFLASIGVPVLPGADQLRPFAAELCVIAGIVGVLLAPFFTRRVAGACYAVAMGAVVLGLFSLVLGAGDNGSYFRGMLVADDVSRLWKVMLLLFVGGVLILYDTVGRDRTPESDAPEFLVLLLGATLGMMLMASASNLLMIFMAVEMASLPSYVLAGFRKTERRGAEASLKYVLFGAVTSSVMAYGLSLLYGLYGTLDLVTLSHRMAVGGTGSVLLAVGLFGLVVGLGFKLSAVPFHFWCPDVFEGASVDVAAFLSVASKGAALVLLLRVGLGISEAHGYAAAAVPVSLAVALGLIGAATATVGNTAALFQDNIRRLLAYSSIAHAGYMICGVSLLVRGGTGSADIPVATTQAILLYLAAYLFMNLGAFAIAGLVARQTGRDDLAGFAGLGRRSPWLAAAMLAMLISLIGLPPMGGFVAKLNLLLVLFQNGGWWIALVVVIGLNTVVSAFYYFRIARAMYLQDSQEPAFEPHPAGLTLAMVCTLLLVLMLLRWDPLVRLTRDNARFVQTSSAAASGATEAVPSARAR